MNAWGYVGIGYGLFLAAMMRAGWVHAGKKMPTPPRVEDRSHCRILGCTKHEVAE